MSTMTFKTLRAEYDDNFDELTVNVVRIRYENFGVIEHFNDPEEQSVESYEIVLGFSSRQCSIKDTTDHAGDVELDYAPQIMSAFATAFKRAYHKLTADHSPAYVFDTPFEFDVPLA